MAPLKPKRTEAQTFAELCAQIDIDLRRLSVDLPDGASAQVKRILLVWARLNRETGYRQGMHELAALIWRVCSGERGDAPREDADDASTYLPDARPQDAQRPAAGASDDPLNTPPTTVEADAFALFGALMRRMDTWFGRDRSNSASLLKAALHRVDPALSEHLAQERIEWQPVVMRWHRVLYMYEFSFSDAVRLWDDLFHADPTLQLVHFVSAAMVLRLRERLLTADFGRAALLLYRYSEFTESDGRQSSLGLVDQAVRLRDSPDQETGAAVVAENAAMFGPLPVPREPVPRVNASAALRGLTDAGVQRLSEIMRRFTGGDEGTEWSPFAEEMLNYHAARRARNRS
ncbi:hypothetical protein MCUN1_002330 [Malassezia cuniculi]|uniref:Rab-GAP TBC domain-containing protein n=1 Tax=Malassezia cuniculi TaxID=948313 RepID=A0AAF0J7C8_9BASI|nr:hypothetical protein MCUN1_002330 [Malassezia cuniculi]